MSEFTSPQLHDGYIPTADQIEWPLRRLGGDVAEVFRFLLNGDVFTGDAGGNVLGGFEASSDGGMDTAVSPGAAFLNLSGTSEPQSSFGLFLATEAPASVTHNDGDSSNPRWDIIVISTTTADKETQSMLKKAAPAENKPIAQGSSVTLEIVEGTPAASPTVPSTPTGKIKLAQVLIPANHTAGLGGTGTLDYYDTRRICSFDGRAPSNLDTKIKPVSDTELTPLEKYLGGDYGFDGGSKYIQRGYDAGKMLPYYLRFPADASQLAGFLYPKFAVNNREVWTFPLKNNPFEAFTSGGSSDLTVNSTGLGAALEFTCQNTATGATWVATAHIPISQKNVRVVEARIQKRVASAVTPASQCDLTVQIVKYTADGSNVNILNTTLSADLNAVDGAPVTLNSTDDFPALDFNETVFDSDDCYIGIGITCNKTAAATAGSFDLYCLQLEVEYSAA